MTGNCWRYYFWLGMVSHVQPCPNLARPIRGISLLHEVCRQFKIVQNESSVTCDAALQHGHLNSNLFIATPFSQNPLISFLRYCPWSSNGNSQMFWRTGILGRYQKSLKRHKIRVFRLFKKLKLLGLPENCLKW